MKHLNGSVIMKNFDEIKNPNGAVLTTHMKMKHHHRAPYLKTYTKITLTKITLTEGTLTKGAVTGCTIG